MSYGRVVQDTIRPSGARQAFNSSLTLLHAFCWARFGEQRHHLTIAISLLDSCNGLRMMGVAKQLLALCAAALVFSTLTPIAGAGQNRGGESRFPANLELRAKAVRSRLFGTVSLYSVEIYTVRPAHGLAQLRRTTLTKGIRVEVLYDGRLPGGIPSSWWEELVPALTPVEEQKLRTAFEQLASGQDIWITYDPPEGTHIRHNGRTVLVTRDHALMDAVLDVWLDDTPVSHDIRTRLLAGLRK